MLTDAALEAIDARLNQFMQSANPREMPLEYLSHWVWIALFEKAVGDPKKVSEFRNMAYANVNTKIPNLSTEKLRRMFSEGTKSRF